MILKNSVMLLKVSFGVIAKWEVYEKKKRRNGKCLINPPEPCK